MMQNKYVRRIIVICFMLSIVSPAWIYRIFFEVDTFIEIIGNLIYVIVAGYIAASAFGYLKFGKKTWSPITRELFGVISFDSPFSIFRFSRPDIRIIKMKNYVYIFPQKNGVWHSDSKHGTTYKYQTLYWFLCYQIIITHSRTGNRKIIPRKIEDLDNYHIIQMFKRRVRNPDNVQDVFDGITHLTKFFSTYYIRNKKKRYRKLSDRKIIKIASEVDEKWKAVFERLAFEYDGLEQYSDGFHQVLKDINEFEYYIYMDHLSTIKKS